VVTQVVTGTARSTQRDPQLKIVIQEKLRAFTVQAAERDQQHAAAVAVVITDEGHGAELPGFTRPAAWSTQAALLLTRRAGHLRKHAGQWALPGGRIDAGETAEQAALRELAEEVHLELDASAILSNIGASSKPGAIQYFINTQKLGKDKLLTSGRGDKRTYTIWETISNTAKAGCAMCRASPGRCRFPMKWVAL
jgi:8-oxo-dGTP pyrophosphatase MutT (NUDIX family)